MWMLTADHGGYVKFWQTNMNNVKMFQAHKEAIREARSKPNLPFFVVNPSVLVPWGLLSDINVLLQLWQKALAMILILCFETYSTSLFMKTIIIHTSLYILKQSFIFTLPVFCCEYLKL